MKETLIRHIPPGAVDYCYALYQQHPFQFKVTKKRRTKLGDYRYDPRNGHHKISVNGNLNRYHFLITYLHEVAHRVVRSQYVRRTAPHGKLWKSTFLQLMKPMLNQHIFPKDILLPLIDHMRNPRASSQADARLYLSLKNYDSHPETGELLGNLAMGKSFSFQDRSFRKLDNKRTRVLCYDLKTQRKYLIMKTAVVQPED